MFGLEKDVKLLYSLARGLEIYTGTVFEAFLKHPGILDSSLCGGGRYDKIIGKFLGSKDQYPATGISFGLDIIYDAVASQWPRKSSVTDVYLVPVGKKSFDPITGGSQVSIGLLVAGLGTRFKSSIRLLERNGNPALRGTKILFLR